MNREDGQAKKFDLNVHRYVFTESYANNRNKFFLKIFNFSDKIQLEITLVLFTLKAI